MADTSRSDIMMDDCSPLSQACIKALTDRMDDKRKFAANEIEKMTVDFISSNNLTMVNRLIIVLGKFCLSHQHQNIRKGGLLGLVAVMAGYRNGSNSEPTAEIVQEVIPPILTCLLDEDSRVRYYAYEALYNVVKFAKANVLAQFEEIFDAMTRLVTDVDLNIKTGFETLNKLIKDIIVEQKKVFTVSHEFVIKFKEYLRTKNPHTRMFIISWIQFLDKLGMEIDMVDYLPELLDGIIDCFYDDPDPIRATALNLLSEFLNKIEARPNGDANSPTIVDTLILHVYKKFCEKQAGFEKRGTFIILSLCDMIKPDLVFKSFADLLKEEKSNLKSAYNLVQKLNRILFTTQPLSGLRFQLGNNKDPETKALFQTLNSAWHHSPIAAVSLCLLTNNDRQANELVIELSPKDITLDTLTQIDWLVQLIESPVFQPLRMRLLDFNNNYHLIRCLYGLLMNLPQSEARRKLGSLLEEVYKFAIIQSHSKELAPINQMADTSEQQQQKVPSVSKPIFNKEHKKYGS